MPARHVPAYHLALAYVGLGDRDAAFAALDQACADRDPVLPGLAVEPRFEPLRSDIRYGRLMTRLGLHPSTTLTHRRQLGVTLSLSKGQGIQAHGPRT